MGFRLIQPPRILDSPLAVSPERRVRCPVPLRFVKYRYPHHAAPSGYDRVCDYIDAPAVRPTHTEYLLGETFWRPAAIACARLNGIFSYGRYDYTLEKAVLRDFRSSFGRLYHFIYAEKSFWLTRRFAGRNGHRLVGTVHHPTDQQPELFADHSHFRAFDHLITMDRGSVAWWEGVTGRANVTWIPHGVDTDFFRPAPRQRQERFQAVFAGTHWRDLASLEAVIERVAAEGLPIDFALIGKAPRLRELACRHAFVGQLSGLSDRDYRAALQRADLLFLPLEASTVCNVVLEALACGTPVMTTSGGIEDYLDQSCAVLTRPGDREAMFDRLLVQAGLREGRRLAREDCRAAALRFSWVEVARQHTGLYQKVCSAQASDSRLSAAGFHGNVPCISGA